MQWRSLASTAREPQRSHPTPADRLMRLGAFLAGLWGRKSLSFYSPRGIPGTAIFLGNSTYWLSLYLILRTFRPWHRWRAIPHPPTAASSFSMDPAINLSSFLRLHPIFSPFPSLSRELLRDSLEGPGFFLFSVSEEKLFRGLNLINCWGKHLLILFIGIRRVPKFSESLNRKY